MADGLGNVSVETVVNSSGTTTHTFGYDSISARLTSETIQSPWGTLAKSYFYDPSGNLTCAVLSTGTDLTTK